MKGTRLSPRQAEALEIIRHDIKRRGVPPSRAELARAMGITNQSSVEKHLAALARKGWVELHPSVERGIQLLREGIPILNEEQIPAVAEGTPIVAEEDQEIPRVPHFDAFSTPFESKPDYFLTVRGDSMDRAGFQIGDMLAVRQEPEPREGDLIVARMGEKITLKRYHRASEESEDSIELQPESSNPEHHPIPIDPQTEDFQIVGIVVGAIIGARGETPTGHRNHLSNAASS